MCVAAIGIAYCQACGVRARACVGMRRMPSSTACTIAKIPEPLGRIMVR
jgi:hypothetical protein